MRISLNWLRELVDINITAEELAHTLTLAGFEVEDYEDRRKWADGVVIGLVLHKEPHPNAKKLSICQVDIGQSQPLNIVCGASNVQTNIYVPVATLGTYLPIIDLTIQQSDKRGVTSSGMICSLAELGLAKDSEGIHIFGTTDNSTYQLGTDVRPLLGLDDIILDVTSTANRADALSLVGIAREISALTGATLKLPTVPNYNLPTTQELSINITDRSTTYLGTLIKNVIISNSPLWLQQRLTASGVRPINNIVDITNYILLEWGQPLHAFDQNRVIQIAQTTDIIIGVRFAKSEETLITLDGQTRTLSSVNLVITASDQAIALAGVMGGQSTEVTNNTTNIILEAALFDPITIRRSSRSQSLRTEASARYERGVNQAELEIAKNRAIALIEEIAQGKAVSQCVVSPGSEQHHPRKILLRINRIHQILGNVTNQDNGKIPLSQLKSILTSLGCKVETTTNDSVWSITIPPYRYRDLEREIDLIEEIARLYGYNHFDETLPKNTKLGYLSLEQSFLRQIRQVLQSTGLTELLNYCLVKSESPNQISLTNPLFTEYSALRTELIPALINSFIYNIEQGNGPLNGFEIGRVFLTEADQFKEKELLGAIMGGDPKKGNWLNSGKNIPMTWYEAKGILEAIFDQLGLNVDFISTNTRPSLHPGRTANLFLHNDRLGFFGQLHPQLTRAKNLDDQIYVFELDLELIFRYLYPGQKPQTILFSTYSNFPASDRDIAFYSPIGLSVAELSDTMIHAGGELLESVQLFDQYQGENVPQGHRSLAFRLIYRTPDRTLTDADVDPVHQTIRETLVSKFNITLRS